MTIDGPGALAPIPDLAEVERRCRRRWDGLRLHDYREPNDGQVFSVDTPPPYVSAAHLHVGHAMSYAQPDFIARYRRMCGDAVFYPIGFDDNGLPTERFVERKYGIDKRTTTRSAFRRRCLDETAEVAKVYEELWRALGLSVDWTTRYSTIDDHCRRTAQLAFVRLLEAGRIYRAGDPVFWDPVMATALAQADLETIERDEWLHDVAFAGADGRALVISTTRPELLPACVALFCHSADERYRAVIGTQAQVPLFGHHVPLLADDDVDPAYGTGLMMVCTFGDAEDVRRWRDHGLGLRAVLDDHGRLTLDAGPYAGLSAEHARSAILADLETAGVLRERRRVKQRVAVSDRSGAAVEFLMRPQWFLRLLDLKDDLLRRVDELEWHPSWMRQRLIEWIDNLRYDWNLSRQRFYGVPIPVWLCERCGEAVAATAEQLPVDPLEQAPPAPCPCGGALHGDPDVLDTWMTSSLTPQILTNWAGTPGRTGFERWPMEVRVQAHDIIRTWLFYTLVQAHLHEDTLPWRRVVVSGWGLNEQGKRISKRDLDPNNPGRFRAYDPDSVMRTHGADAIRHWAARASLGQDVRYSERDVKAGRKVVIKLWNVARFCQPHLAHGQDPIEGPVEDRWIRWRANEATRAATAGLDSFDYSSARQAADDLLWIFADDWLELAKHRIWFPERHRPQSVRSASATMTTVLRRLLSLYAPFLPYVTEELFTALYAPTEEVASIHLTAWPTAGDRDLSPEGMQPVLSVMRAVRAIRTERRIPQSQEVNTLIVDCADHLRSPLELLEASLLAASRARRMTLGDAIHDIAYEGIRVDLVASPRPSDDDF